MSDETTSTVADPPQSVETNANAESPVANAETSESERVFDHAYVSKLRQEAADARVRAKRADAMASELVKAFAAIDGRLVDPDDLPFTEDLLDDDGTPSRDKVAAAIDALIGRKPHLAARRPNLQVAQGARPEPEPVNLLQMLRANT